MVGVVGVCAPPSDGLRNFEDAALIRVELYAIFENLVFAITSKMLRILTEYIHVEKICSLETKLFLISIISINGNSKEFSVF